MPLLLLFVITPVLEMWLLIEVGSRIGSAPTIAFVLLTAMVGLALLKRQGFSTLTRANERMEKGEIPAEEMITGLFLAVGGALLLTPGFLTDMIGFACLLPGVREVLFGKIVKRMTAQGAAGSGQFQSAFFYSSYNTDGSSKDVDGEIIEGEFTQADLPEIEAQNKKPEDGQ